MKTNPKNKQLIFLLMGGLILSAFLMYTKYGKFETKQFIIVLITALIGIDILAVINKMQSKK